MQPTAGATLHLWRGSTLADQDPRCMPTEALAEACRVQAERFMHDQANDDSFALELFRRAACDGDGGAWDGLVECYRSFVLIHLHRHPAWPTRTELDDDYWVMRTFQRFWPAASGDRLQRSRCSRRC